MVAKVADLGPCSAAKQRLRSSVYNVSSIRALRHVAPEVLRKSDAGLEADIYAFGIMMWELYTGQQAYRKLRDAAHLHEVRHAVWFKGRACCLRRLSCVFETCCGMTTVHTSVCAVTCSNNWEAQHMNNVVEGKRPAAPYMLIERCCE
jgi:hypothetical protein